MTTETNIHLLQEKKEILSFDKEYQVTIWNESELAVEVEAIRAFTNNSVTYVVTIQPNGRAYWPFFKGTVTAKPLAEGIAQLKIITSDASHWLSSPISPYPRTIFKDDQTTLSSEVQPSLLIE